MFVLSKPAVVAQDHMPMFKEAQEHHLLQPLSAVPPAAKVLYVSHRWTGHGEPDNQDAHAFMQVGWGVLPQRSYGSSNRRASCGCCVHVVLGVA